MADSLIMVNFDINSIVNFSNHSVIHDNTLLMVLDIPAIMKKLD